MNLRLRGGALAKTAAHKPTAIGNGIPSFNDILRGKAHTKGKKQNPDSSLPGPYIVEKTEHILDLAVEIPEVTGLFDVLQARAVICRFNGYWPKPKELHAWIHQNWSQNCNIYLCVQKVFSWCNFTIQKGPWFSGRAGLVISPWVPGFNTNTMVVTKMTVWVRLHNVPLPFCHHQVLENIGNSIGRFIMLDRERMDIGIFTFARLCKEMDLRKGLPDLHIFNSQRTQVGINT